MRLRDLLPTFLQIESDDTYKRIDAIELADGVQFLCPKCFEANGFKRPGVHSVICWRPRVPQSVPPTPGRWEFRGTGYDDLTLYAGSSSILLTDGCRAHFFIERGAVRMSP